jgi:SAM-dependent methyltransferase
MAGEILQRWRLQEGGMNAQPHSATDLQQIYQRRFSGLEEYRRAVWRVLVDHVFSKWIAPSSSVLDLGSGYCEFINQISARHKYAMDLNPATGSHADKDVTVLQQDCSAEWQVSPETLDAIFTSNFFEHLPDKTSLEQTVHNAFHCLKPGGRLIALGPNIRYTGTAYWDFFDHYIALTDLSLIELLQKCGFEIEYSRAQFLPYTMANGRRYPAWVLRTYIRLTPLWRLFGKQFLIVARKTG